MNDTATDFNLEDAVLPSWIKKGALRSGGYPYSEKMDAKEYDEQLGAAHLQLSLSQDHMARTGMRIVLIFEGRDAAGKGGTIRTYLQYLNPRFNLAVALPKPNDRERTQWYFQR